MTAHEIAVAEWRRKIYARAQAKREAIERDPNNHPAGCSCLDCMVNEDKLRDFSGGFFEPEEVKEPGWDND